MVAQAFSPTPDEADHLLALIANPGGRSLSDIAAEAGVSLPALTLWLSQPEIAARLDAIEALAARRVRLVATEALPLVVQTLTTILKDYVSTSGGGDKAAPSAPASPDHAHRRDETARKAAALLARLSRFTPGPTRPRATTTNAASAQPSDAPSPPPSSATLTGSATPTGRCDTHPRVSPTPASLRSADTNAEPPTPASPDDAPEDAASSSGPASVLHGILSVAPESVNLSDPGIANLLQQLAQTPPDQAEPIIDQLLKALLPTRESG